jgi:hypothetical protein
MGVRNETTAAYSTLLDCVKKQKGEGKLGDWPHFIYMKTSLQHFDTPTGGWPTPGTGAEKGCVAEMSAFSPLQTEDDLMFKGKVDYFLGEHFDQRGFGHLHVGHKDCTHWTQPGVPDILAAELVNNVL